MNAIHTSPAAAPQAASPAPALRLHSHSHPLEGNNPARAIGPMILVGRFTDWWAYLIAPIIAAALAVTLYDRYLRPGSTPG